MERTLHGVLLERRDRVRDDAPLGWASHVAPPAHLFVVIVGAADVKGLRRKCGAMKRFDMNIARAENVRPLQRVMCWRERLATVEGCGSVE